MYFPIISRELFLLALSGVAFAADTVPSAAAILQRSEQLIRAERYQEAIALLEHHRSAAGSRSDERSEALILNQLGLAHERQGSFQASRNAFDSSIARLTRAEGENTVDLVRPLNNLANLLYESDQAAQAEALVRRGLKILDAGGSPNGEIGIELAILAKVCLAERKMPSAQKSAEKSLQVLHALDHVDDLAASVAWSVLGAVYDNQHKNASAEDALREALLIVQAQLNPQDYRVGEGMANLGLLYASHGSREKAEPLLEQAHSSFRANAINSHFVREFLVVWAKIERKAGHEENAKDLTNEAKALQARRSEALMSRYVVDANALR